MGGRSVAGAALAICIALLIASCSATVKGTAVSVFEDPFKVAGMPAVDGPTGPRPVAKAPSRDVENSDGGEIDELAASSISDIEDFWEAVYPETFDEDFTPVKELISWDANGYERQGFCGLDTYGLDNAGYCFLDHTIGWDRGELLPDLKDNFGDIAITNVLAHEYGHAIQHQANLKKKNAPTLVAEQQADCFAGAYMRWVAEDNSDRFTLSTGDGLNNVLAAMISFGDPLLSEDEYASGAPEHGSAFERITAFQFGFTDGAPSCAAIDAKEIAQRRGDLPVELQQDQTGEWPVSEESVTAIVDALGTLFSPADPPKLSLDADATKDCPDARPSPPVSFCPATNTIAVDMSELEALGAPSGQDRERRRGVRRQHGVLGPCLPLHAGPSARARWHAARQRRGSAAHRVPDRGRDDEDDRGGHHVGRQHRGADRRRPRRGRLRSAHQRVGGQRRQRRDCAVRLLPDGRVPHWRARRRGPLLQAVPVKAIRRAAVR